jgi:predicted acylesterase/phospholipase RssA
MVSDWEVTEVKSLELLRSARRVGFVFSGGSTRCAFQVGVLDTLTELDLRPSLCVGVSAGGWNAAAVAAGTAHRLHTYWRAFVRMPHVDVRNLLHEHSPFIYAELHRRTFGRYVGAERLRSAQALPLWIGVTHLRDLRCVLFDARQVDDPLALLLASNYMPPYYTHPPRLDGELYVDGGLTDNTPYEKAFAEGCDAVVLITMRGKSQGPGILRNPREVDHRIPSPYRERTVVIRPRHRLPLGFTDWNWPRVATAMEIGRLRAREVLLGERHPETDVRGEGGSPAARVRRAIRRRSHLPAHTS